MNARDVWSEINAKPLSSARWGAAIRRNSDGERVDAIPLITERPIRLQSIGRCPTCGDRFHGCPCELSREDEE